MKKPIRIVILADTPTSVGQIHQQLRRARVSFYARLIGSREALIDELHSKGLKHIGFPTPALSPRGE